MPVYVMADIKVTSDGRIPDYVTNVHNLVHKHGGKYLSRCGERTDPRKGNRWKPRFSLY